MNKIKCAVIGVGYLGKFHAQKYTSLPNAELVAVCDADKNQAEVIAKANSTNAIYDYHDLIGKVDAVSIVVPTSMHYEVAKVFLEHKINVLLEKPITSTISQAKQLIRLAEENKIKLQIGHLERFNSVLIGLQKILHIPFFIESTRIAPFKLRAIDVNVVLDLMIHDIDIIQSLVKAPIKHIYASGAPVLTDKLDIVNARIEFETGCVANVTASRVGFTPQRQLKIFQHDAFFSGDLHNKTLSIHRKGINEIISEQIALQDEDTLVSEIKAFLAAISNNTNPIVSGEDGLLALETAVAITDIVKVNIKKIKQQWPHVF